MKILVTGAAGFIGYHTAAKLLDRGDEVLGIDNLNDYYDVALKKARLSRLVGRNGFRFLEANIADRKMMTKCFAREQFDRVINLAAQAGVRYSLENPYAYIESNISGFLNILEGCRHNRVAHCVFASSSSVYGANTRMPFSVKDQVDHPLSLYEEIKRVDGAHVCEPLRNADDGLALFHGLRTVGKARYGAVYFYEKDSRR